ncbi:Tad domain-containing protein [Albidovulum sediminicola]|uniref:Pilus assembly protein TadG-related protein n=1 Tax=Albidovulum sediminicola TaxID=2984331 RepID=A0ABT2Z093_9RHOB|nr:Tad domain-containing protein [Defluviimonas sp. WL0075]MCV2864555.1 pilus assembly protein TadG-related protein [Defluviimonas sp. WL0075]
MLGLFCFLCMLILAGVALDVMYFEEKRTRLQNTLDRSVLAAADLNQTLPPKDVVKDYFTKSGLTPPLDDEIVANTGNSNEWRSVKVNVRQGVPTMFMRMVGTPTLTAPALGAAEERVSMVEISLVLDVSGSMNSNSRLTNLKPAAKAFVDQVFSTVEAGRLSMSIIPYSTQVSLGAGFAGYFNLTDEHASSHCIEFDAADYKTTTMSPKSTPVGDPLGLTDRVYQRNGHFDPFYTSAPLSLTNCPTETSRGILPFSGDRDVLKNYIDALTASGNTSIDIGMKWGAALVDPSMQYGVTQMIANSAVYQQFDGRPADYSDTSTLKVVVIMTDGENTTEYRLRDSHDHGPSLLWRNTDPIYAGKPATLDQYSLFDPNTGQYYSLKLRQWRAVPYGDLPTDPGDAVQMSWPSVWATMSINWFADRIIAPIYDNTVRDQWRASRTASPTANIYIASEKDARTNDICSAAKDEGIKVFTIGFEAPTRGLNLLKACASSPAHFYSVSGLQIADAFAGIASSISKLRLTE